MQDLEGIPSRSIDEKFLRWHYDRETTRFTNTDSYFLFIDGWYYVGLMLVDIWLRSIIKTFFDLYLNRWIYIQLWGHGLWAGPSTFFRMFFTFNTALLGFESQVPLWGNLFPVLGLPSSFCTWAAQEIKSNPAVYEPVVSCFKSMCRNCADCSWESNLDHVSVYPQSPVCLYLGIFSQVQNLDTHYALKCSKHVQTQSFNSC